MTHEQKITKAVGALLESQQQLRSEQIQEQINAKFAAVQQAAMMVGITSNILLDKLNILSQSEVVWAKELKRFGNLFMQQLAKTETKLWNHVGENQDEYFNFAFRLEQALETIISMPSDQLVSLIVAVQQIASNEVIHLDSSEQMQQLLDSKAVIEKAIKYIESKPRISQAETLQYLRSILPKQ